MTPAYERPPEREPADHSSRSSTGTLPMRDAAAWQRYADLIAKPSGGVTLSCSGVGKKLHGEVVLSTPLRPWTDENGGPAVLAHGAWPASQELWPETCRERWRFKCPVCPVDYSRRETDLAWIVLRAMLAGKKDLSISDLLASQGTHP